MLVVTTRSSPSTVPCDQIVIRHEGTVSNKKRGNLDVGRKFFTKRVVRYWNKSPIGAPSLVVVKARLDGALSNLV